MLARKEDSEGRPDQKKRMGKNQAQPKRKRGGGQAKKRQKGRSGPDRKGWGKTKPNQKGSREKKGRRPKRKGRQNWSCVFSLFVGFFVGVCWGRLGLSLKGGGERQAKKRQRGRQAPEQKGKDGEGQAQPKRGGGERQAHKRQRRIQAPTQKERMGKARPWPERISLILEAGYHSQFAVNQEVTLTEHLAVPLVKDWFALFPAADVGSQGGWGGQARPKRKGWGQTRPTQKGEEGKVRPKKVNGGGQALTGKDGKGQAQPKKE